MIPLSQAILQGAGPDPLDAALSAVTSPDERSFAGDLCQLRIERLHDAWPQLGASVRTWPQLAQFAEQSGFVSRVRPFQHDYRREVHQSVWEFITDMQGDGHANDRIAGQLAKVGL